VVWNAVWGKVEIELDIKEGGEFGHD